MIELCQALGVSSLDERELDSLVAWANERAGAMVPDLRDDPELGPLLRSGGTTGAPIEARAPSPDEGEPSAAERAAPTPVVREDSKLRPPLPPIPSEAPGYQAPSPSAQDGDQDEELELEEVELLDDDDLELVEESLRGPAPTPEPEPEWRAALATAQEGDDLAAEAKAKNRTEDSALIRLQAEEEAVKEHEVDLSDLDDF
jgi:hypothetical protein